MRHARGIFLTAAVLALALPLIGLGNDTNDVTSYSGDDFEGYGVTVIGFNGWHGDVGEVIATTVSSNYSSFYADWGTGSGSDFPLPGYNHAANTKILSLEAGGAVLTNRFTEVKTNTWIDMLVLMNPADEPPAVITNDIQVQAAFYLNTSSNLVIFHGTNTTGSSYENIYSVVTNKLITENEWVRLTLGMDYTSAASVEAFGSSYVQIMINGDLLTNDLAFSAPVDIVMPGAGPGPPDGGTYWLAANHSTTASRRYLHGINFSGAGFFDDIVARDDNPFASSPPVYTVSVVNVAGGNIWHGTTKSVTNSYETMGSTSNHFFEASNTYYIVHILKGKEQIAPVTNYSTTVTSNTVISALFEENSGTLTNGVTEEWMQKKYGIYTDNYTNAATDDPDNDGYTTSEEYLWSCSPVDSNSIPRIDNIYYSGGTLYIEWYSDYNDEWELPPYAVMVTTDITDNASWTWQANVDRTADIYNATNRASLSGQTTPYYYYKVTATN